MMTLKTLLLSSVLAVGCFVFTVIPDAEGQCTAAGWSCDKTCANIQHCDTADDMDPQTVTCDWTNGKYCLINNGVPSCDGTNCEKITCGVKGPVPSPSNCSQYYTCDQIGSKTPKLANCEKDTKFDTITKNCTANSTCDPSSPHQCAAAGDTPDDITNYCYVCIGANEFFIYDCTPVPSTDPPTTSTTASPLKCTAVNEKFPDESDCHSYFICVQNGTSLIPQRNTCRSGMIYDQNRRSCVTGTC